MCSGSECTKTTPRVSCMHQPHRSLVRVHVKGAGPSWFRRSSQRVMAGDAGPLLLRACDAWNQSTSRLSPGSHRSWPSSAHETSGGSCTGIARHHQSLCVQTPSEKEARTLVVYPRYRMLLTADAVLPISFDSAHAPLVHTRTWMNTKRSSHRLVISGLLLQREDLSADGLSPLVV